MKAVAVGYYPPVFRLKLNRPPTYPIRPIIKHNARSSCFTAAAGTCIRRNFSIRNLRRNPSLRNRAVTTYVFISLKPSLNQAFAHCSIFLTEAPRMGVGHSHSRCGCASSQISY